MAASAKLTGILDVKNEQFIKGMNDAVAHTNKTSKAMFQSLSGVGAGLAAGLSAGAVVAGARSLIDFGSNIKDMSDSVSLSTDKFQQFSFAIEQSGGTQEAFVKGMSALIQKLEEAKGGNDAAIASFQKLGISLSDIGSKRPDEILLMIADALKASDGSGAAFAATCDIIGSKVALKMVPALKDGSAGFSELANSADTASKSAIKAADDAGDAWDRFKKRQMVSFLTAFAALSEGLDYEGQKKALEAMLAKRSLPHGVTSRGPEMRNGDFAGAMNEASPISLQDLGISERQTESTQEMVSALDRGERVAADMARDAKEASDAFNESARALREIKALDLGTVNFNDKAEEMRQAAIDSLNGRGGSPITAALSSGDSNRGGLRFGGSNEIGNQKIGDQTIHQNGMAGLLTGHLETGSLRTGGLGSSAHNLVRRGDAARAKKDDLAAQLQGIRDEIRAQNAVIHKPNWSAPK